MTILYNLFMAVVDLTVLIVVGKKRNPWAWWAAMAFGGLAAVALAFRIGPDNFNSARLACYGLFLHGVIVLIGSAPLLWRATRRTAIASAAIGVCLLLVAADAFLIEPTSLEVTYHQIVTNKIHHPVRVVVLADLQTDHIGPFEEKALRRVLQEKPDVILLAGDYLQCDWRQYDDVRGQLNALLRKLDFSAPEGVFAVRGNIDPHCWAEIFSGLEVTTVESTASFNVGELRLTCLGMGDSCNASPRILNDSPERFHVVMGHVPNFALGHVEADLLVAGHTHGGQARLPLLGPLVTNCEIPRGWAAGVTNLSQGGQLLVSRGVGMERAGAPPLRFLCRPELVVVDLLPQEQ